MSFSITHLTKQIHVGQLIHIASDFQPAKIAAPDKKKLRICQKNHDIQSHFTFFNTHHPKSFQISIFFHSAFQPACAISPEIATESLLTLICLLAKTNK